MLLGAAPAPPGIQELTLSATGRDIVRRVKIATDDELASLKMAGFSELSVRDWLRPLRFQHYAERRLGTQQFGQNLSLQQFWSTLAELTLRDGLAVDDAGRIRVLSGPPGGYFGKHQADQCEGRWSEIGDDGVWCAYRRGYSQAHWHPVIIGVSADERRVLDLFDLDEWRWAVLARGLGTGSAEQIVQKDELLRFEFPAPEQLMTLMDLLGSREGAWSWRLSEGAPAVEELLCST